MGNRRMVKPIHADQVYSHDGHATSSCIDPNTNAAESSTVELVDDLVIRSSVLEERLHRLKDNLEGVDETGDNLKPEGLPSGLNTKLEKSSRAMEGADTTLQKVIEYLGFSA